jgi:hypothetical protein
MSKVWHWLSTRIGSYRGPVEKGRVAPIPRPHNLDTYSGLWVAVTGDEVVAAAATSHELALQLDRMDHRKRARVVTEFVRPDSDVYIVGAG